MSVGSTDLHKAIVAAWDAANLDDEFNDVWSSDEQARYPALHQDEATPGQPFPYCVYEMPAGSIVARMTGHSAGERHVIKDTPLHFRIYTKQIAGDSQTSKERGAELSEKVMETFGGHPTVSPDEITLDNGSHLITQYQTDYPVRMGDEEYQWNIDYTVKTDVPVAV